MMILAGAFLTFLGFLVAGLLALVITAALDKSLGKERALLLFSAVLFLFAMAQCSPDPVTSRASPKPEKTVPANRVDVRGDPYYRPGLAQDADARNPFRKHTDTRPLAPIELESPPWPKLPFELPPTVPGPAPVARRVLRGEIPVMAGEGETTFPEIPEAVFADYHPVADDVYDWVFSSGRKNYIYIKSIKVDGRTCKEGEEGYAEKVHDLANKNPGWDGMTVEWAMVGSEEKASSKLAHEDVIKVREKGVSTTTANHFDRWYLRRTVDNLRREILTSHGLPLDLEGVTDIQSLRSAASQLAEIGRTGKESKKGWKYAAEVLEVALDEARRTAAPGVRSEILGELVDAYVALREEKQVLRVLSEYARTSPNRPEPWLKLGQLHLISLGVPAEALAYFEEAASRSPRNPDALMGKGDALTAMGRYEEALEAYELAGGTFDARVRVAEGNLRLGRLQQAAAALTSAMALESEAPRALLAHGAILYVQDDLDKAAEAFQQAAVSAAETALEFRAQALYDLGLTFWRQGKGAAAAQAFDEAEKALEYGSSPGRDADETVSPAFGRALVALASGDEGTMKTHLQQAREEAPRVSYHEMLTGMIAATQSEPDHAAAVRAFERALRLTLTYPELDGWLARTRLDLGRLALQAGTPIKEAAGDFEAAVAFAARASRTEEKADKTSYMPLIREAWIRLGAEHLPTRQRYHSAREVVQKVLKRIDREQPEALTILGYCDYHLAQFGAPEVGQNVSDPYDACIRDFQQVLNKVTPDDEGPWKEWRAYSADMLEAVKHWRSLEEKIVTFTGPAMPPGWEVDERGGVKARIEDLKVQLRDAAKHDGTLDEPTFVLSHTDLFKVGTFEEVRLRVKVPAHDRSGAAINTITFGVQVQRASRRGGRRARYAGLGVFFDRGKVAVRVGGGQLERYKEGNLTRVAPEMDWPSNEWVEIRIVRLDTREGRFQIYLDPDPDDQLPGIAVFPGDDENPPGEIVSGFKGSTNSPAELWIGGYSTQAQEWDVELTRLRIIRRKKR